MLGRTVFRSLLSGVLAAVVAGAPTAVGSADGNMPPVPAVTAAKAAPALLAGIAYDPAAPLDAHVTPLFSPKDPPKEARTYRVTYRGADGAMVPALLTLPGAGKGNAKRHPLVLLVHGLTSRKEDTLLLSIALARRGYGSFAIDLAGHGERPLPTGRKSFADLSLEEVRQIGARSVIDLRRAVDVVSARPEVDSRHLSCIGISLGGIFGGVFAGVEPRIGALVLWSAGGDWGKLFAESRQAFAVRRRERGDLPDAATVENTLSDIDPLNYIGQLNGRPLLLLAGDKDTIVPVACTDELFAAAHDPKQIKRYPGGHIPDLRAMTVDTLDFLDTARRATAPVALVHQVK